MIILKLPNVFEVHIKFKAMKLQLVFHRNYQIFYFQAFPKDRAVFRTYSNIKDGAFCENSEQFKDTIKPYFCQHHALF